MSKRKDISGVRFGRVVAIKYSYTDKHRRAIWDCKCDCGNIFAVSAISLRSGNTRSCGCLRDELRRRKYKPEITKHGLGNHAIYSTWHGMIDRCCNPKSKVYHNYGGRGISVCCEWKNNIKSFYLFAKSNGWRKGLTIDRIDNNGNYTPENCRFITRGDNTKNTRQSKYWIVEGKKYESASEAAFSLGVSNTTIMRWCGVIPGHQQKNGCFAYHKY